jgi:hypothetical protein
MSNHFISINRGKEGMKVSDFTTGTASTAGDDIELRIADVDAQGNALTRLDVVKALEAFERAMNSGPILTGTFPPL